MMIGLAATGFAGPVPPPLCNAACSRDVMKEAEE